MRIRSAPLARLATAFLLACVVEAGGATARAQERIVGREVPDSLWAPPALGDGEALAVYQYAAARGPVATVGALGNSARDARPTVVVVTGLVGSAFGFRQVIPALAREGWRVIVVDPLGMGWSAAPRRADYSFTAQAARVAGVLDTLDVRDAVLVGQQLGAAIALRLAIQRPELACAVVSIAGAPMDEQGTPAMRRALSLGPLVNNPIGRAYLRKRMRDGLAEFSGDDRWITKPVVARYMERVAGNTSEAIHVLQAMVTAKETLLLADALPRLRAPVHLLHGVAPGVGGVTPDETRQYETQLRGFTMETLEGVGQFVHEEQPGAVVRAVTRHRGCARGG